MSEPGSVTVSAANSLDQPQPSSPLRVALLGNPNTGKTTLFNRLCGLRHKTSNFPGTTLESRIGRVRSVADDARADEDGSHTGTEIELVDLPGIYSLELDQLEAGICRSVLAGEAAPAGVRVEAPDAVCVVLDATNLGRNLMLAGEILRRRLPTVVAVNMIDLARKRGLSIDRAKLSERLGCAVVLISARTGEGVEELRELMGTAVVSSRTPPGDEPGLRAWCDDVYAQAGELSTPTHALAHDSFTDRLDRVVTHPVLGLVVFLAVMGGLFYVLFRIAEYPMGWIESVFSSLSSLINTFMPEGILRELLTDGVVSGISGTVVFLPQICLLFFLISLLEDTGYLARAAFVADRVLRPFGLPGHSFVPLLSSHACALPGIMATRAIPDRRERLATILVAPFMTCSARLPVYVLLTTILFRDRPALAAAAFVGCYALGMLAGVLSALVARRTILRGTSRAMALELPSYKLPSLRTALLTTYDRALVFLKKAGTNILMICIVLWWLGAYPHVAPPAGVEELRAQASMKSEHLPKPEDHVSFVPGQEEQGRANLEAEWSAVRALEAEADHLEAAHAKANSFIGRLGRAAEPVFRPLGYDWQLTVGVLASFAAREVFVSTMAVVLAGAEDGEDEGVRDRMEGATRRDGVTPVFSRATCWSLLVFFVLAMQCLPTLAVTARESGGGRVGWRWALLQLAWMSTLAYLGAAAAYWLAGGWAGGVGGAGGGGVGGGGA